MRSVSDERTSCAWPQLVIAVLFFAFAQPGCGDRPQVGGSNGQSATAGAGEEVLRIAVIPKSTGGEFWEAVEAGAESARQELGVEMRWDGTLTETEIAEQNKIIENMINLEVDGIALAPLNRKAQSRSVESAVDAGIPVVVFDSAVDGDAHTSFVATNNKAGGALGASHFVEQMQPGAKLLVMRYLQGAGSTEARCEGFIEAATAAGLKIVADPYPEDGSVAGCKKTAANVLEGYVRAGQLDLDGIFACNLYSALGVAAALDDLRESGVEVDVNYVGFDSSPKLIDGLQRNRIQALVVQNPIKMGHLAVETLVKHLRGEQVETFIDTGVELVTAERLEKEPSIRELVGAE